MAGTKLVREERVPTVEIAEVAHGDRALMSRARRFKSPHPDHTYKHLRSSKHLPISAPEIRGLAGDSPRF